MTTRAILVRQMLETVDDDLQPVEKRLGCHQRNIT